MGKNQLGSRQNTDFLLEYRPMVIINRQPLKTVTCDMKRSYSWQCIVYQTSQAIKEEIIKFDVIKLWLVCADLETWVPLNNVNNSGAVLGDTT